MAQGDYKALRFNDYLPYGTYWQPLSSISIYECPRCGDWHPDNVVCNHPLPRAEIKIERCEVCGRWHGELYQHPPTPLETHEIIWCETD